MREDWIECKLGEIFTVSSGKGLSASKMDAGKFPVYGGNGISGYHSHFLFEDIKLIIGRVGAKCGVVHITQPNSWVTDNALVVNFNFENPDLKFFKLLLEIENLNKLSNSTAQPVISGAKIYEYDILLPPLPEQRAIVKKLESLFSSLDAGVADLKKAQQQLKIYRQAVLKKAFEGELTNSEIELISLANLTTILGDGLHGTPKYSDFGEYYFINGNNLKEGKIILKPETKRVDKSEFEKYKKNLGNSTVLVSINGTIGNTAFYNNENVVLGKSACYFNLNDEIDKYYIRYNLTTKRFLHYAVNNATGSTIMNVGLKTMREYLVPVPKNRIEQHQIVKQIESRLSVCDSIEQNIKEGLEKAEVLRHSILKKAFEGNLLTVQELAECKLAEDYEPAGMLLERLKNNF